MQGMITGIVKNAKTKLPIKDVVITINSSAFKGQNFAVTDTDGVYRINNLPPGIIANHLFFALNISQTRCCLIFSRLPCCRVHRWYKIVHDYGYYF